MLRPFPILLACFVMLAGPARTDEISEAGRRLAEVLDRLNVEANWQPGQKIDWRTGKPDGQSPHCATHCSAFVAAAAAKLGVYILRPPEHSQVLLANAQHDWLDGRGREDGWRRVKDGLDAQRLANRGQLVVASFKAADTKKPGHIAIVRPSDKSEEKIRQEGPQIIQAGVTNYNSTNLKEGFKHHPGAFANQEIRFFAHEIQWK